MKAVRGKSIEPSVSENENQELRWGRERLEDRERGKVSSLSTVALRCEQQEQGEH